MFCRVGPCFLCSCVRLLNRSRAHVHGFKWQYVQLQGWVSSWREIVEDQRVACFLGCCLSAWKSLACAIHPLPYCTRMDFVFRRKNRDSNSLINTITYGGRNCLWCEIVHLLWVAGMELRACADRSLHCQGVGLSHDIEAPWVCPASLIHHGIYLLCLPSVHCVTAASNTKTG